MEETRTYDNEIWKAIRGYEGLYEVSNLGRVRSSHSRKTLAERGNDGFVILRSYHNGGYEYITLCKDGVHKKYAVHRLVAFAFIPNPESKPAIDHLNTIRDDNRVNNLRWVTAKENIENPLTRELIDKYLRPVKRIDKDGNITHYKKMTDTAIDGFRPGSVFRVCQNQTCFHRGYLWRYEEDDDISYAKQEERKKEIIAEIGKKKRRPIIGFSQEIEIEFQTLAEANEAGYDMRAVWRCCNGKMKKYKGYEWRYK